MARVRALWRHPIKGHGRESLDTVELFEGQTMPWDRRWAVAHEAAKSDGTEWAPCANYSRGSKVPALMAINTQVEEATGTVTLTHPDRPDLRFDPDRDIAAFLDWVRPLMPANRAQSVGIHRVPGRGMTDSDFPSISLINLASHQEVANKLGHDISTLRWRCNIHFDGVPAWEECNWIGKPLRIGDVELQVKEPILRCLATTANPETGDRDADTLGTLKANWDHQNFGIYAMVTKGGIIHLEDKVEVL
ncbi:MOSC N-terminal beta barrel domain-containing protein [uncultured Roseovarius sp.]|uniref:MOSC domain-containing protein n=1 Tax=uncultured Roseovarius sp. TaxID=293344 RepID=UPI002615A1FE|nr:MOSC N-terminal beta barrel domain-containing protein [uncultured Roseovarius sp.]